MKFPDEYFDVTGSSLDDYQAKVESGRNLSKNLNILFCATCKNVSEHIEKTLNLVHETGGMFKNYHIYLYENNSTDDTVELIRNKQTEKLTLDSENIEGCDYERSKISLYERSKLIARARNKYVDYINANGGKYDYVFVFDVDLKGGWSKEGILNSIHYLETDKQYDCITAYCVVGDYLDHPLEKVHPNKWLMYDSFAFRFVNEIYDFPKNIGAHNYIRAKKGGSPILVGSNFNGLAIYRPKCFKQIYYSTEARSSATEHNAVDIDHVTLHRSMHEKDMKVYMNPSMITCVSKHKYSEDY